MLDEIFIDILYQIPPDNKLSSILILMQRVLTSLRTKLMLLNPSIKTSDKPENKNTKGPTAMMFLTTLNNCNIYNINCKYIN